MRSNVSTWTATSVTGLIDKKQQDGTYRTASFADLLKVCGKRRFGIVKTAVI